MTTTVPSTVTLPYPSQLVKNPSFETFTNGGAGVPPWTLSAPGLDIVSGTGFKIPDGSRIL